MSPKRVALYAAALAPLVTGVCSGAALRVDIHLHTAEDRSPITTTIYPELPEWFQALVARHVGSEDTYE